MLSFIRTSLRPLLFLLLCALPTFLHAQVAITGRVIDDDKTPLPLASARLLDAKGKILYGTATDNNGYFVLKNVSSGRYTLKISFVGQNDYDKPLEVGKTKVQLGDIKLTAQATRLNDVVVTSKAADVMVKNDTLEYNASNYTLQTGASLQELIKKLPGAQVDADGNITVNGKAIKKIMVDGKEFFSSDPKVAGKNLPADLVQRVQVMDRQSDMSRMSGFDDGEEETVINLKIKPEKKKGLFGTLYAGAGTEKRWEANGIVNRFDGDSQWTVIVGGNNTNNMGFSDTGVDLSQSGLPRSLRRSPNDGVTTSDVLGFNAAHVFSPQWELGGNMNYGYADKLLRTKVEQQNFLKEGSTTQKQETSDQAKTHSGSANARIEWNPNDKTELVIQPSVSINKTNSWSDDQFETLKDADGGLVNKGFSNQVAEGRNLSAEMRADFSRKLNDVGRTLSASVRTAFDNGLVDGIYKSNLVGGNGSVIKDLNQQLKNTNQSYDFRGRLSWVEPIGKGYFIQALYQLKTNVRHSNRDAYGLDDAGLYSQLEPDYSRRFANTLITHSLGLNIKKRGERYDLTAGFSVDPNTTKSHIEVGQEKRDPIVLHRWNYSPSIRYNFKPNKTTNLGVFYRGRTGQPSIQQMMPVPDITNPLVEYVGNPSLRPSYSNDMRIHFQTFSSKTKMSLSLFLGGSYVIDDIVSSSLYDINTGKRTITYRNVSGNGRMMFGGFWTMPLFNSNFSLRLSSFNSINRNIGYINNEENRSLMTMLNNNLSLNYRNGWLDTEIGGRLRYQNTNNSIETRNTLKNVMDYELNHSATLRLPLNIDVEYDMAYRTNKGYSGDYKLNELMLNGGISWSFLADKSATIRLKGYDILNQHSNITRSSTALALRTESTNTIGRYFMVHFIYRFNIFGSGASKADMRSDQSNGRGYGGFGRGGGFH